MLRLLQTLIGWEWPMRLANPLLGAFNPFHPDYRLDPYPTYRRLLDQHPVYFARALGGGCVLTRHADIAAVLSDPRFSVDRPQAQGFKRLDPFRGLSPAFVEMILSTLLMVDPPRHTRLRRLVNRAFTPRMVDSLKPRIQAVVDELLAEVRTQRRMDLIQALAYPLPVVVIAELLGIPSADRERFKHWSDTLAVLLDPLQAAGGLIACQSAFEEMAAYLRDIADARRQTPRDDLISALVAIEDQGDALSGTELVALCGLILGAGHETTTNLIANAVLALLRHPHQRRRLQDDPSLIANAVEEFLRYDSPVQATDRVVLADDVEFDGRRLRRGNVVLCLLGAANRDPARYADPDRLDLTRPDIEHLAFGRGPHFCLGAALARAEAQIAIPALLRAFPELDGDRAPRQWKKSIVLRGPTELRLTW
jgi:pimeloyl-[acyl-carrier protein] synthase